MSAGRYIDIPGSQTHELPPLLVHWAAEHAAEQRGYDLAIDHAGGRGYAGRRDLPTRSRFEQRKFELALQLSEQYKGLVAHWSWGDSVLEWIRQCEITFESEGVLRKLLHPDVWPHASRASFVALLLEKEYPDAGHRTGSRCGNASRVSPAAACGLRFEPVSLLPKFDSIARRL